MKIRSTLTLEDIHKIIDVESLKGDLLTVDDILIIVADAAASRAVHDLIGATDEPFDHD